MIHGAPEKWAAVGPMIAWCRQREWRAAPWRDRPFVTMPFRGNESPNGGMELTPVEPPVIIRATRNHGHCKICGWMIADDDEHRGYTCNDETTWVCEECFERFLGPEAETSSN